MALIVVIAIVVALFGALAQLAIDYPMDSRDLVGGERDTSRPAWAPRPGPTP